VKVSSMFSSTHAQGLGYFSCHHSSQAARSLIAGNGVALELLFRSTFGQHPDAELFRSVPGAGEAMAPRLLNGIRK